MINSQAPKHEDFNDFTPPPPAQTDFDTVPFD